MYAVIWYAPLSKCQCFWSFSSTAAIRLVLAGCLAWLSKVDRVSHECTDECLLLVHHRNFECWHTFCHQSWWVWILALVETLMMTLHVVLSWKVLWTHFLVILLMALSPCSLLPPLEVGHERVWCDVLNYPAKHMSLNNNCRNTCCLFNVQPQNEGSSVSWPLLYGEDIDAAACRAEIARLTLSTVVSVTMASALNSVTVAATILALVHLLVVCDVVVFTNFLQSFRCENSFPNTSVDYWYNSFHEAATGTWNNLLRLWCYGGIDHGQRSQEAAPFFSIQVDIAWKCFVVTLVGMMKADILGAVSECDDGNFFSFCQFNIVVWSFQHRNVTAQFAPDVGGESNKSFATS